MIDKIAPSLAAAVAGIGDREPYLDDRIGHVHARESVKEVCAHMVPSRAPSMGRSGRT